MGKMNVTSDVMLNLFAEMVWDKAILKFKQDHLYEAIDHALAEGDEVSFLTLTSELKSLQFLGDSV